MWSKKTEFIRTCKDCGIYFKTSKYGTTCFECQIDNIKKYNKLRKSKGWIRKWTQH